MRLYEEAEPAQPETESSPAHDAVYTSNVVSLFAPRKAVYVLGYEDGLLSRAVLRPLYCLTRGA